MTEDAYNDDLYGDLVELELVDPPELIAAPSSSRAGVNDITTSQPSSVPALASTAQQQQNQDAYMSQQQSLLANDSLNQQFDQQRDDRIKPSDMPDEGEGWCKDSRNV
nr:hypothetical protein L203_04487 [Cryptococcus depauperatus CBS 7841]ODO00932.1 hypothetical protein L204_01656 [Cryptococcus depauperatus CBS 7855]